ncbi:tetratricopeptide repeat protein [Prevotella salivae]|uniref:Tetratricopeptide repeat protein n=1 Tax=Segatella salivae TaxID=228604 RepID=A0AAW4NP27_9BACT|nr:tetratricopeptide repeat protein [Segatella salivae]
MDNANKAYKEKRYQQAIKDYELLLRTQRTASLYYNLGNAYYRTGNYTKAILNYERAAKINPSDRDIKFNLQFVRAQLKDGFIDEDESFLMKWYKSIINVMSIDCWAILGIISIIIAIFGSLSYFFMSSVAIRKYGFYISSIGIVLFILSTIFAISRKSVITDNNYAIVLSPIVYIKNAPNTGTNEILLHEGTKVYIIDRTFKDWYKVKLSDNREGWLPIHSVEEI